MRTPAAAGHTQQLAARLKEGGSLSREEYLVLLFSQFWLHNDKTEVRVRLDLLHFGGQRLGNCGLSWGLHGSRGPGRV
jgi:hypothetical protein